MKVDVLTIAFFYTLQYMKTKDSDEEVVQDGIRVFIEKVAQWILLGAEVDYIGLLLEYKLSSKFVCNDPNITEISGCEESFNIWNSRTISLAVSSRNAHGSLRIYLEKSYDCPVLRQFYKENKGMCFGKKHDHLTIWHTYSIKKCQYQRRN